MYINGSTDTSELSKTHFTLEELNEMNRDMDSIMRLTDSLIMPHTRKHRSDSNIILLRPDITPPHL